METRESVAGNDQQARRGFPFSRWEGYNTTPTEELAENE